jgi:hypothetical protein
MVQLLKARREKPKYKPMMWSSSDISRFFFYLHVTVVILVDTLARLMKKSGTLKQTMVAVHETAVTTLCIQNCCYE